MSEKSGKLNYRFPIGAGKDTICAIIMDGEKGFQYELMVNGVEFSEARRYYNDIRQAILASQQP
eukprot:UN01434